MKVRSRGVGSSNFSEPSAQSNKFRQYITNRENNFVLNNHSTKLKNDCRILQSKEIKKQFVFFLEGSYLMKNISFKVSNGFFCGLLIDIKKEYSDIFITFTVKKNHYQRLNTILMKMEKKFNKSFHFSINTPSLNSLTYKDRVKTFKNI